MRQKVKVSIKIYDMQGEGIHAFAPAFVSGLPVNLLIDTGASRTIFDVGFVRERLEHIAIDPAAEQVHGVQHTTENLFTATLPDVYFNTVNMHAPQVRLLDLSAINRLYIQMHIPPVQGIIGSDWLYTCRGIIDYSTSKLKLKIPVPEPTALVSIPVTDMGNNSAE